MPDDRHFVVVTGLPGSGKSTLARNLSPLLGIELIDKDDFLEQRLDEYASVDATLRSTLSRKADEDMRVRAEASNGAVLVSFWRRDELSEASGTPTRWLFDLPNVVEVHCQCDPNTAVERFRSRRRHEGHGDETRSPDTLISQFETLARLGSVGVGKLVVVDTEIQIDARSIAARVLAAWPTP